jgi:L-alanine-DL-glutamate epimerase-like enolase superfamily enzyme
LVLYGFHRYKKIHHLCEQASIRNLTGQQADSSIGTLASAHLCAAFKNTSFYYPSENSFFLMRLDNLLKEPLVIKGGCLELSTAPGLGIEIDGRKLEKLKMP